MDLYEKTYSTAEIISKIRFFIPIGELSCVAINKDPLDVKFILTPYGPYGTKTKNGKDGSTKSCNDRKLDSVYSFIVNDVDINQQNYITQKHNKLYVKTKHGIEEYLLFSGSHKKLS